MNKNIIYSKPHKGSRQSAEYPLFDQFHLCKSARYVGGTSNYLCECQSPLTCPGVLKVADLYGEKYWRDYTSAGIISSKEEEKRRDK